MRRLLLEDVGRDVVELAADAMLPLIAAHPAAFNSLGERFVHACIRCGWQCPASLRQKRIRHTDMHAVEHFSSHTFQCSQIAYGGMAGSAMCGAWHWRGWCRAEFAQCSVAQPHVHVQGRACWRRSRTQMRGRRWWMLCRSCWCWTRAAMSWTA